MNAKRNQVPEQGTYKVTCDVFDLKQVDKMQQAIGCKPIEWHYTDRQQTGVTVTYKRPEPTDALTFNINDLLDDILTLFLRGHLTNREADELVTAIEEGDLL